MNRRIYFGILAVMSITFGGIVASDHARACGNTVTQAVVGGTRIAVVSDLELGSVSYSHTAQANAGTMTLTADDSTGTGAGWNVTIQSSAFVYDGTNGGANIPAANFSITTANAPAVVAGQAIDATNGPKVPASGATGTLDSSRKVLQANPSFGLGRYSQALAVSLVIPAQSRAGSYTNQLTVTIAAAP